MIGLICILIDLAVASYPSVENKCILIKWDMIQCIVFLSETQLAMKGNTIQDLWLAYIYNEKGRR